MAAKAIWIVASIVVLLIVCAVGAVGRRRGCSPLQLTPPRPPPEPESAGEYAYSGNQGVGRVEHGDGMEPPRLGFVRVVGCFMLYVGFGKITKPVRLYGCTVPSTSRRVQKL